MKTERLIYDLENYEVVKAKNMLYVIFLPELTSNVVGTCCSRPRKAK